MLAHPNEVLYTRCHYVTGRSRTVDAKLSEILVYTVTVDDNLIQSLFGLVCVIKMSLVQG